MNNRLKSLPAWAKVLAYFLVLWLATIVAGIIPALNDLTFFFAVSFSLTWLLLRWQRVSLLTLGIVPANKKDTGEFFSGLGIGALMFLCCLVITLLLTGDQWAFNPHVDPVFIFVLFLMNLWSAYVQEFVFRGYPFQTLLRQYPFWLAQFCIAIPFGLMHVHQQMGAAMVATVMLTTGSGSLLFGLAYWKTGKLMLPVGLHLGWNYLQALIPRTAGGDTTGLIILRENHQHYGFANVVLPYLVVVLIAFIGLWIRVGKTRGKP